MAHCHRHSAPLQESKRHRPSSSSSSSVLPKPLPRKPCHMTPSQSHAHQSRGRRQRVSSSQLSRGISAEQPSPTWTLVGFDAASAIPAPTALTAVPWCDWDQSSRHRNSPRSRPRRPPAAAESSSSEPFSFSQSPSWPCPGAAARDCSP